MAPRFFAQVGPRRSKVARAQIDAFEKAVDQFRLDTGHFPSADQGLAALVARPAGEQRWAVAYSRRPCRPIPWGNAYVHRVPGVISITKSCPTVGTAGLAGR